MVASRAAMTKKRRRAQFVTPESALALIRGRKNRKPVNVLGPE
jgi:hypothetical protein